MSYTDTDSRMSQPRGTLLHSHQLQVDASVMQRHWHTVGEKTRECSEQHERTEA